MKKSGSKVGEKSRQRYAQKENVTKKWINYYGKLSPNNSIKENQICIREILNLLDSVFQNKLQDVEWPENKEFPKDLYSRINALREMGYKIPKDLNKVRILRNTAEHEGLTVFQEDITLSYDDMKNYLLIMADTLIAMGAMDAKYREPSFEELRLKEGDVLRDEYVIIREIGEGGMSRVFESKHPRLDQRLAIKELKPNAYVKEIIENECNNLLKLHHWQIPQIYDTFFTRGTFYIVMDYVEGNTLEYVCKNTKYDLRKKIEIIHSLCGVLRYLHSLGMVFADLKPQNIIIDDRGVPHLIDFGITKSQEKKFVGALSENYVAPEVYEGKICIQTDIYAVGRILKEMVWEEMPLGPTGELTEDERWNQIRKLIYDCMQPEITTRPQTIREVQIQLDEILKTFNEQLVVKKPQKDRIPWGIITMISIVAFVICFIIMSSFLSQSSKIYSEKVGYSREENELLLQVNLNNATDEELDASEVTFEFEVLLQNGRKISVERECDIPREQMYNDSILFTCHFSYEELGINKQMIKGVNYIGHKLD